MKKWLEPIWHKVGFIGPWMNFDIWGLSQFGSWMNVLRNKKWNPESQSLKISEFFVRCRRTYVQPMKPQVVKIFLRIIFLLQFLNKLCLVKNPPNNELKLVLKVKKFSKTFLWQKNLTFYFLHRDVWEEVS